MSLGHRGSLRWYDPDRFDGYDLSRAALNAAPLADTAMMVIFVPRDKGRVLPLGVGFATGLGDTPAAAFVPILRHTVEFQQTLKKRPHLLEWYHIRPIRWRPVRELGGFR